MNVAHTPPPSRADLVKAITVFTTGVLHNFVQEDPPLRNVIIRNTVARSSTSLVSVHYLTQHQHGGDCWAIFRTMTDRLFHLHWIGEHDEFEAFEEWSFIRQYEAQKRALSDSMVRRHRGAVSKPTVEQKARYKKLMQTPPQWTRPKPEDAARSLGLPFLYKYGYDFASTHVHPMANDGEDEFGLLCGTGTSGSLELVVENAILVHTLILQEALNRSSLRWARIVYDFVEAARSGIAQDSGYNDILVKLMAAGPTFQWSAGPS
jgi:hypothetical protein